MSLPEEDLAARGRSIFERLRQEQDPELDTLDGGADAETPQGEPEAGQIAGEMAADVPADVRMVASVAAGARAETGGDGAQPPAVEDAAGQLTSGDQLISGEDGVPLASTGEVANDSVADPTAAVVTEEADGEADVAAEGLSPALEGVEQAASRPVVAADGMTPAPEPTGELPARQEVAPPPAPTPDMAPVPAPPPPPAASAPNPEVEPRPPSVWEDSTPPAPAARPLPTSLRQDLEDAASHAASLDSGPEPEPRSEGEPAGPASAPEPPPDLDPRRFVRPLPRVLAIANQKGGVGKTTTTVNLGASLAVLGYRVLVIDLDPQGNATTGLGINSRNLESSIYDVILHDVPLEDCVEATQLRNLFVAPATIDLAGAEIELVPAFSRELRLRRALEEVRSDYDFVLIDCPPSLGLLTVNALSAATEVAVPIQCEYYALEGLGQLLRNVNLVQSNLNPKLELSAIVLTMYDGRTKLAEQVADEVRQHFGDKVCRNVVPRTVRLSEAPSFGQPIIVFDPSSRGALAYRELAMEVSGGPPQRTG